ncbi:hypothetical protein [Shewanella surugensis]|uniref:Uncharacterized protein n=1 Tax=Shewanella surugensis TaxID=212020 RepID=A0ABT0LC31_9GAMM|nr:hypothetical protein [Shewanella surugensis]MCL1125242.1 hypothetical protein [Shewanella surugensis]
MNTMDIKSLRLWVMVIFILMIVLDPMAMAVTKDLDLSPYTKTNYLLSKGRYKQASEHWDKLSVMFLANRNNLDQQTMWQSAGLAAALATIAADKNNDPIAYQYWADSTRYLLTGGTNWQQLQAYLHQRLETANTQLSVVLQVNDVTGGLDENLEKELSVLQVWDDKLNFFQFVAPKLGLNKYSDPQSRQAVSPPNARQINRSQGQKKGQQKKLSGFDANFSQTQSFIATPGAIQTQAEVGDSADLDAEDNPPFEDKAGEESIQSKAINSSAGGVSSASQGSIQSTPSNNPLARGNLAIIQDQQLEARQKRHSSSPNTVEPSAQDGSSDESNKALDDKRLVED